MPPRKSRKSANEKSSEISPPQPVPANFLIDLEVTTMLSYLRVAHATVLPETSPVEAVRFMIWSLAGAVSVITIANKLISAAPAVTLADSKGSIPENKEMKDLNDGGRRRHSRRRRSASRSDSEDRSRSRSRSPGRMRPFQGTSLHAHLPVAQQKDVKDRLYVHFQWATSFALANAKSRKLILPSSHSELLEAVSIIGDQHARAFPGEADAVRKYCEDLLYFSRILSVKGLFLADHYARLHFAETKCLWFPLPPSLVPRLMVIFTAHRADLSRALCFCCGDPAHRTNACPFSSGDAKTSAMPRPRPPAGRQAVPGSAPRSVLATHHPAPKLSNDNVTKCYDFTKGMCAHGAACKYSHLA
jgi:hypothetical protein